MQEWKEKKDQARGKRRDMKVWKGKGGRKNVCASGVVDVADSSDDRFGWISGIKPQKQPNMPDDEDNMEGDEVANAQLHAGDFKTMSQLPTSIGGHFQLSTEKFDETADSLENTEAGEYFTLNLKLLNAGLQTIPFYKRMEYSTAMFTAAQLNSMNDSAELAEKYYQTVLSEHEHRLNKQNSAGSKKSQITTKAAEEPATTTKDELDDLLDMTAKVAVSSGGGESLPPTPAVAEETAPAIKNDDDIQQWLDNVLEE